LLGELGVLADGGDITDRDWSTIKVVSMLNVTGLTGFLKL